MIDDERQGVLDRVAADPVVVAREEVRRALTSFLRWPWSKKRQQAFLFAFDRMLDVFVNRIEGTAGQIVAGPYERLAIQQGRHEVRISKLEQPGEREVGG